MDLFDFNHLKREKANAMLRYRRLRKIENMFRFIEICLVLIFLSWVSTKLPIIIKISSEYFNHISVFLLTPGFVFLLGNVIILTLFLKSGQFPDRSINLSGSGTDLYDEFVKNSKHSMKTVSLSKTEDVIYQDKQTVYEEEIPVSKVTESEKGMEKMYQRSKSENLNRGVLEKRGGSKFRRSETEKCRKVENLLSEKKLEDEMSNEELNKKVEAFIAKQMKFHREESMAIVIQNQNLIRN